MSRFNIMPRAYRRQLQAADQANVARAVRESHGADDGKKYATTLPGDSRKLRGIPAIGRSVRGATGGSVPGENLWR